MPPRAIPATPTAPVVRPRIFIVLIPPGVASDPAFGVVGGVVVGVGEGAAGGTAAASRTTRSRLSFSPSLSTKVRVTAGWPVAVKVKACSPGSTLSARPPSLSASGWPSTVTLTPLTSTAAPSFTSKTMVGCRRSSSLRRCAQSSRTMAGQLASPHETRRLRPRSACPRAAAPDRRRWPSRTPPWTCLPSRPAPRRSRRRLRTRTAADRPSSSQALRLKMRTPRLSKYHGGLQLGFVAAGVVAEGGLG